MPVVHGQVVLNADGSSIGSSTTLPTGAATSAKQDLLLAELQLKADLTETQPVSLASVPSHAVTNAGTFAVQVTSAPTTTVTATDLDIRNLVNTDVVTAELSAVDNAVLDAIEIDTTSIDSKTPSLGQALAAASTPVVLTAVQITTLTPQTNALTDAQLRATAVPVSGTFFQATQPVSLATAPVLVAGTALIGKVGIDQVTANANEVVTKTGSVTTATLSAETTKVIGTVNQGTSPWTVKEGVSATSTATQVADTATSTTILASNANRMGATVQNDSTAILYLLLGSGTASSTNYTVRMVQYAYYETPYRYTGQLSGVWATDPNTGGAKVDELT